MRQFCVTLIITVLVMLDGAAIAQEARWRTEGWKTDFSKSNIDLSEVRNGGPPRDGIPPIDNPKFVAVSEATDLVEREPVIGLEIKGDARAYPLRVMTWHEIVNDRVGGVPVAITYCPLCNAAIAFDARIDGRELTFGTTGKLRNSDLIMYDRTTESWWQQFIGEAVAGELTGKKLKLIPARLESWNEFKTRHPQARVLIPNSPNFRSYGRNPYVNYDVSARPSLYNGTMPKDIEPMARVVVVRRDDKPPIIISLAHLRQRQTIKLEGYELYWRAGQASALHSGTISEGRDVGTVSVKRIVDGSDAAYDVTFAFVAHAFHPETAIQQ